MLAAQSTRAGGGALLQLIEALRVTGLPPRLGGEPAVQLREGGRERQYEQREKQQEQQREQQQQQQQQQQPQ